MPRALSWRLWAAFLAGAGLLWWWLSPATPPLPIRGPGNSPQNATSAAPRARQQLSLQEQEAHAALLRQPGLRYALEAWLQAADPSADPDTLAQRLQAVAAQHFPPPLTAPALALMGRYLDYRRSQGQLKPPPDLQDPDALRLSLAQLRGLQLQHFDAEEYDALFGAQQSLDDYTLARLDIAHNPDLNAAQKQQALAEAEALLPPPERAARAQAQAALDATAQSAAFEQQGTDDATRLAQRSSAYGAEAAQRLAQLDQQERNWQARLAQYAQAQAQAQGQDSASLQQLRTQLFTPQEQLRLDAALQLHR